MSEQRYWDALTQIYEMLRDSEYFDHLHPAETPEAVVNTFARFLKLAQDERGEMQRLAAQARLDADAYTLLTKVASNIRTFSNLSMTPVTVNELQQAWEDFYEEAFQKRKAYNETVDLLNDIMLDLERLNPSMTTGHIGPNIGARRSAWTLFYSQVVKAFTELKALHQEHAKLEVARARLADVNRDMKQQLAYQIKLKSQAQGKIEGLYAAMETIIKVNADKLMELARKG